MTSRGSSYQIPTPRGEEADRLDYWYDRADELYWMTIADQVGWEQHIELATALDDEGVGEYYRALCAWEHFTMHPRLALHPLLLGYPAVKLPCSALKAPASVQRPQKARAVPRTCTKTSLRGPAQRD